MICQTVTNLIINQNESGKRTNTAVNEESGFGLTQLVSLVVERCEKLEVLDLAVVSLNAEHVSSMVEAIYQSKHTQLKKFVLAKMGITFDTDPDLQEMMCEFISRQEKLESAIVNYTLFRSAD